MAKKKEQTAEVESTSTAVSKGVAKTAAKGRKRASSPKVSVDAPSPQPEENHSNGAMPAAEKNHTHHSEPVDLHHGDIRPKVQVTNETISVRAYFLSQARHAKGLPADPHADWLEAERLLHHEQQGT